MVELILIEGDSRMIWLNIISYAAIAIGIFQAIIILIDIIRYPQKMMPIMNIVWPLTGLYFPVFGIWAYFKLGREKGKMNMDMSHMDMSHMDMETGMDMSLDMPHHEHMVHHSHSKKPFWQSVLVSTTHCSSGCSLGDLIGAPLVFALGLTIAGSMLFADYVVEFILAYLFGIAFQYYGMGFQKHDHPGEALKDAIKADTLSLICFEIGMFIWMALVHYVFFTSPPMPNTAVFWFMMQLAMMFGFCTSYPANWYLVRKGVKHGM
ncbi:DUF4396 domain-containing protein [Scopulibacillus cellulosilyticus]|uniref:DUF4396 domain-containing protein n=1 Tax=Scopulibacillus cellulosilyticus TaxID=2665665 RepID=A0ABW2Q256_9BACL